MKAKSPSGASFAELSLDEGFGTEDFTCAYSNPNHFLNIIAAFAMTSGEMVVPLCTTPSYDLASGDL